MISALSESDSQRPLQTARDRRGDARAVALAVELRVVDEDAEVVQVGAVFAAVEPRRHLLDDRQAERLEHGQQLAQRDLAAVRRDRHARQRPRAGLRVLGPLVLEADRERLARGDALQQLDVLQRELGRGRGLVVLGQARRVELREPAAVGLAEARDQLVGEAVVPGAREPRDLVLELVQRHVRRALDRHVEQEEELRRRVLDEREVVLDGLGVEARGEQLLEADAQLGRHAVAGHRDHDGHVAAGRVAAHRERDALRLLRTRGRDDLRAQRLDRSLEQLVARERLERGDGRLEVVRALDQPLGLDDRLQLAAQERRARGLLEVDERREQADHAQQARERAVGPQDAHRDVVHARAAMDARAAVGLADHEQVAGRRRAARAGTRAARRPASARRSARSRPRAGCRGPSRAERARSRRRAPPPSRRRGRRAG